MLESNTLVSYSPKLSTAALTLSVTAKRSFEVRIKTNFKLI
ncbi:hypothetical protein LEP1GSC038_3695 [Leptospira weilii str. 2006001855]|uniref:Uncharacterized protein n=2 Tax=Leptospira TaxID=171 RepID=M6FHR1_9LEPT|nr:hypothetical protein LEP1GSC038_3695 [Leptospira weilii str. 2006001855]